MRSILRRSKGVKKDLRSVLAVLQKQLQAVYWSWLKEKKAVLSNPLTPTPTPQPLAPLPVSLSPYNYTMADRHSPLKLQNKDRLENKQRLDQSFKA